MKQFLTAFFLACLSLFVSCGTKGPQTIQKEGFVLVYDTLSLDLKPLVLPGCRLSFEQAVKVGEDYLCLFQQQNVYDRFMPTIRTNLLLRVNPETGSFHEVPQPYPVMAEERLVMWKDTVYLVEQPRGRYRFIPEEETWVEGSFNEDVVYEDADWRVVTRDIRYAGSHTWFIERKTGKEYFFFTKPGQILPYNGYYYLTDPERFRGIADPHEGFLCDSTSTYEAIMKDCPDCSFNVIHRLVASGGRSFKTAADIYAFGDGDDLQHVLVGDPPVSLHRLPLDEGDHRVTAAEGEGADPRESQKQIKERVFILAVRVFFKIAQDARVQLFFVKPRLEIHFQAILMLSEIAKMRACGEYQRAGNTEMRKQHLAKLAEERLVGFIERRERHVSQRKALQFRTPGIIGFQRDKRGSRLGDGVASLFGEPIAVAGGAGCGVAESARANDGSGALDGPGLCHYGGNCIILCEDLFCFGVQDQ